MTRTNSNRLAAALMGLAVAPVASADVGGITAGGWWSILLVVGIVGVLFAVHKKLT